MNIAISYKNDRFRIVGDDKLNDFIANTLHIRYSYIVYCMSESTIDDFDIEFNPLTAIKNLQTLYHNFCKLPCILTRSQLSELLSILQDRINGDYNIVIDEYSYIVDYDEKELNQIIDFISNFLTTL